MEPERIAILQSKILYPDEVNVIIQVKTQITSPLIETIFFSVREIFLYQAQNCSTRYKSQLFKMKIQIADVSELNLSPGLR